MATSGSVTLEMLKLKGMRFAAAIIDRHKCRETSLGEAMIEIHLAGMSTRRIEPMKLAAVAKCVCEGYIEALTCARFPRKRWKRIRANDAIEWLNWEIRCRTRVVGTFPDGKSAFILVIARVKYVADNEWSSRYYLDVSLLER